MTNTDTSDTERPRHEPAINDDVTLTLYGGGPRCPGCSGPTYAVTGDDDAEKPWWCKECNVRLDDDGGYGSQARFPADSKP